MKRLIIFLILLLLFGGIYNSSILRDSVSGFFGDKSYQKDDFQNAKARYTDVLKSHSGKTFLEADTLFNLGNTLYRLGEKEETTERVKLWKEAVGSYTKSLSIRIDKETEDNLAFVREKLQKEEQEQKKREEDEKKQKEEEQKNNTGSGAKEEQSNEKSEDNKSDKNNEPEKESQSGKDDDKKSGEQGESNENKGKPQSNGNWSNGGSYNPIGGQNKDDVNSKMSDADKKEVEKYLEALKQFAKQNGKLLNPEKGDGVGSISDQIRDFFGNDSFFQDVLPGNEGKKDW